MKIFDLTGIKSWKLRLFILILIGVPAFTGWPLVLLSIKLSSFLGITEIQMGEMIQKITWIIYSCFIWLIVYKNVKAKKFFQYMSTAFVLGLTTVILGRLLRFILPIINGDFTEAEINMKMLNIFVVMITAVPFSLLFINSFSAKNMIQVISKKTGKRRVLGLHLALALRVLQHVGEVVSKLMDIWAEEHPKKIIPRHRKEWSQNWYKSFYFFSWAISATFVWINSTMMHTFEPIPGMADEMERIKYFGDIHETN